MPWTSAFRLIVPVAVVLGGCAQSRPPADELAASRAALHRAEQAAPEGASSELESARRKVGEATAAFEAGRYAEARRLAEQAAVDAEHARLRALTRAAEAEARELQEQTEAVRRRIEEYDANGD